MKLLYGLAAFAGGVLVSWLNYLVMKAILRRGGGAASASPLRTLVTVVFFVLLYLIGGKTGIPQIPLLVGGALGLTAGLAYFTRLLIRRPSDGDPPQRKE